MHLSARLNYNYVFFPCFSCRFTPIYSSLCQSNLTQCGKQTLSKTINTLTYQIAGGWCVQSDCLQLWLTSCCEVFSPSAALQGTRKVFTRQGVKFDKSHSDRREGKVVQGWHVLKVYSFFFFFCQTQLKLICCSYLTPWAIITQTTTFLIISVKTLNNSSI